jgi:diadenosine tetraphosphatase ApaH/serine/threonine PP2A family protein phosphatase
VAYRKRNKFSVSTNQEPFSERKTPVLAAALGNISGNWPALQSVLSEIDRLGIHTILNTGDAIVGYPWPNDVAEELRNRPIVGVQSDRDRLAVRYGRKPQRIAKRLNDAALGAVQWAHEHTHSKHLEFVGALPLLNTTTVESVDICVFNGLPTSPGPPLVEDESPMRFQRVRETVNTPLIICGQTLKPFSRWIDNALFVNPGSVGLPEAGEGVATFALVNTDAQPWSVEISKVTYDADLAAAALRDHNLETPLAYYDQWFKARG